jgi:LysR family transcriptional regulator, nod-box dependent transcriptional activator
MRLDNFDLNLLIALNVLLEEESVTRAAERMNLTQSAMSAALSRLRIALNDELLVPHGRRMLATPHARALAPTVADTILRLRALLSGASSFDPATSQRRFEFAASDYITSVLIAPLLPQLKREAPGIELSISLPNSDSHGLLNDGKLDFMLMPEEFLSLDHPRELLFEERHVVVGWSENPVFQSALTEDAYYSCGHVATRVAGVPTFVESVMQEAHEKRRVEVFVPSFTLVPWLLPGTHHLALMHERMAKAFAPLLPLTVVDPPFPVPVMREMIQYHAARTTDQGLQWLLAKLMKAAFQGY